MATIRLTCKQCGGKIILDNSHEIGTCESCFTQFLVKQDQIIQQITQHITKHVYGYQGKDVEELLADGYRLINLGNNRQANTKFKRAIDLEPDCWDAWLGFANTLPDTYEYLIAKVNAYQSAFELAESEKQQVDTYIEMLAYIPDSYMRSSFVSAFNLASNKDRKRIFQLVSGVIGCDDSEIASLAIDLCPDDWKVYFAMGKIRQIRARWAKKEGFFRPKLPVAANEVVNIFVKAYQLAKTENDQIGADTIKKYIIDLSHDSSYQTLTTEVLKHMK